MRGDPANHWIDQGALEALQADAVVHLAGESIIGLWHKSKKRAIRQSRVDSTQLLADALAALTHKPKVLVSASAIGYYGNQGEQEVSETHPAVAAIDQPRKKTFLPCSDPQWGARFLSDVVADNERATQPASEAGIRVVRLRIGVVLDRAGGALARMRWPFKLGIAGPMGNGKQYMSWIERDDLLGIIYHALTTEDLKGPVNAVAPNPVTNGEFTRELSRQAFAIPGLGSLTNFLPLPGVLLKLVGGEMANAIFLSSTRVAADRVQESGYRFRYPALPAALRAALR